MTPKQEETLKIIKAAGRTGVTFADLKKKHPDITPETLRNRLMKLSDDDKIQSKPVETDRRKAVYTAI